MKSNPKSDRAKSDDNIENKTKKEIPSGLKNIIPEKVKPIIDRLPPKDKATIEASLIALSIKKSWSGPLPSPDTLAEYNKAFPNGAEKIYNLTKSQSEHRMSLENLAISSDLRQSERGQVFGVIIALSFFIGAFVLILLGHEYAGTILGTVDLVALVSVFVIGKDFQKKSLKEKSGD